MQESCKKKFLARSMKNTCLAGEQEPGFFLWLFHCIFPKIPLGIPQLNDAVE
jgi:hypothetical protein